MKMTASDLRKLVRSVIAESKFVNEVTFADVASKKDQGQQISERESDLEELIYKVGQGRAFTTALDMVDTARANLIKRLNETEIGPEDEEDVKKVQELIMTMRKMLDKAKELGMWEA